MSPSDNVNIASSSLRQAKEAFVSGHSGTSLYEATLLILTPVLVALTLAPDRISALAIPVLCGLSILTMEAPRPIGLARENGRAVTILRGVASLSTVICILAVDFDVFPRRLAKSEWFGTGLMDIGVGAFCFSAALVTRRSTASIAKTVRAVVPLLVLGLARLLVRCRVLFCVVVVLFFFLLPLHFVKPKPKQRCDSLSLCGDVRVYAGNQVC